MAKIKGHLQVSGTLEAANFSEDDSFYGITVKQTDDLASFSGITVVAFNTDGFYVTQNDPNTDEAVVNLRDPIPDVVPVTPAAIYESTTQQDASVTATVHNWADKVYDPSNLVADASTDWNFTCPFDGVYAIDGRMAYTNNPDNEMFIDYTVNGVVQTGGKALLTIKPSITDHPSTGDPTVEAFYVVPFGGTRFFNKDDVIRVRMRIDANSATGTTIWETISIVLIAGSVAQ